MTDPTILTEKERELVRQTQQATIATATDLIAQLPVIRARYALNREHERDLWQTANNLVLLGAQYINSPFSNRYLAVIEAHSIKHADCEADDAAYGETRSAILAQITRIDAASELLGEQQEHAKSHGITAYHTPTAFRVFDLMAAQPSNVDGTEDY